MIRKLAPEILKAPIRAYFHSKRASRSQAGQDLWVFGEVFDEKRGGFFVDIGAHDGVTLSNTYILESKYAWTGICVEANPDNFMQLTANRKSKCIFACLDSGEGVVEFAKKGLFGGIISKNTDNKTPAEGSEVLSLQTISLATLLKRADAPSEIDYLSIDVEGAEERVLGAFPFNSYRFKCMTIERPTDSLKATLKSSGYILIKEIPGLDCFYIHESFVPQYSSNVFSYHQKKWLMIGMG